MAETTGQVRGQAGDVAQTAKEQSAHVAETVKEQAGQVAGEVKAQGREVLDRTKEQVRQQGETQAKQAAASLRTLAGQTRALAEGRTDEAGPVTDYVRQASERIEGFAERVQSRGAQGIVEDLEQFARRRPGAFLAGAAVAGFVTGRLIRSASSGSGSGAASANGGTAATWPPPTAVADAGMPVAQQGASGIVDGPTTPLGAGGVGAPLTEGG
jgi:ElaB/YqjD/DUF883 family membrane-anchored ribosome-binding protein